MIQLLLIAGAVFGQVVPPDDLKKYALIGGGVVAVVLVFVIFRPRKKHDPEGGLAENLAKYPPPPKAGRRRLLVQGHPMRLRLVAAIARSPPSRISGNSELMAPMNMSMRPARRSGITTVAPRKGT